MWATPLPAKMQRVADELSGFHCNIAVMTENEGDPANFSSLMSVLT
jgi:phosphotransferase system HPr-like phosphotransfer protein